MASRKGRRNNETKISFNAKKQLIAMIVSVALMIFSVFQVYYLARYTLGYEISPNKLKVYRWVQLLVSGDTNKDQTAENN